MAANRATLTSLLLATFVAVVLIPTGPAFASGGAGGKGGGGGGGGGSTPLIQMSGPWSGSIVAPAPPQTIPTTMSLSQDAAGNVTGQLCTPTCAPTAGRVNTNGTFQLRGETYTMTGGLTGTVPCADGTTANWISGAIQERGGTGSFSFTGCP